MGLVSNFFEALRHVRGRQGTGFSGLFNFFLDLDSEVKVDVLISQGFGVF